MRCVTSHRRHCRKNTRVRTERSRLWGRKWEQDEKKKKKTPTSAQSQMGRAADETQQGRGGGGLEKCHSSHTHADGCYLLRTAYLKMPLSETACCKDKGCKDGNVNPADGWTTATLCCRCLLHSTANASAPTGTLTLQWETLIVSPAASAHSHLLPTVCFLHL